MLNAHLSKKIIQAVLVFITFVISLYFALRAVPEVQAQEPSFAGSRFFKTTITPNDEPLLAKAFFNDTEGNTVVLGAPLVDVISKAYGLPGFQIVDGPDWIQTAHLYDIEAVPPPAFVESNEERMLQALLADRFGFEATRASREIPALVLELVSDSLKFEPSAENAVNRTRSFTNGYGKVDFSAIFTLDEFALFLSRQFNQPVINQTGLPGKYLIQLEEFTRNDPNSLVKAMLEQLGLTLELRDTMLNVLVVSRIEHPTLDD